jgi:adenosylcobinamide kinase / adenosylcobinamide-phosphate guanylyltransferase
VYVLLIGTGGVSGWPENGCRCASCLRAGSAGLTRRPGRVLVDGALEFVPFQRLRTGTGSSGGPAHQVVQLPGGFDITGPDGGRLLLTGGPGEFPEPLPGALPYDIALLDLLGSPAQLGRLRATGLIRPHTIVAALYADHRITSEQELARRCELWRVTPCEDGQLVTSPAPGLPEVIPAPDTAAAGPHRTLILGGARSGKSTEAELRLAAEPSVTYLAAGPWPTADDTSGESRPVTLSASPVSAGAGVGSAVAEPADAWIGPDGEQAAEWPDREWPDSEWTERVARHRARRPRWWRTVETLDIAGQLRAATGAVLIDGIGTWLAGVMDEAGLWAGDRPAASGAAGEVSARIDDLIDAWRHTKAVVVAVTDEVGSGLVPPFPAGRVFRDQLGWLNQRLAAESELNLLVVAGRVTTLPD